MGRVVRDGERRSPSLIGASLRELAALALPTTCGGCGRSGPAWCGSCSTAVTAVRLVGPHRTAPVPCPAGLPPVWTAGPYAGPLQGALVAYKDGDRRDLRRVLAPVLADVLSAVLTQDEGIAAAVRAARTVWLVPVPSSAASVRRRGDIPLNALLRQGTRALDDGARCGTDVVEAPCLRLRRRVADQAGLDHRQRAANLDRAMEIRPRWRSALPGSVCVLVDDVVTTGATLVEATRVLRGGDTSHVVAVTIAATERRVHRPFG